MKTIQVVFQETSNEELLDLVNVIEDSKIFNIAEDVYIIEARGEEEDVKYINRVVISKDNTHWYDV